MIFWLMLKVMLCLEEEREKIKEDGNWFTSSCILGRGARSKSNGERKQKTQNLQKARQPNTKREKMQKQERQSTTMQKIVSLAVVEEKFNRQISSTAATKTGHWLLDYLYPKENAYFETQSLLGQSPPRAPSLFKLLHYRSMDKHLFWYSRRVDYEIWF